MGLPTVAFSSFCATFSSVGCFGTLAFTLLVSLFLFPLTSCSSSTWFLFRRCVLGALIVGLKHRGATGRSGTGPLPFDFGFYPSKARQQPFLTCLCIKVDSLFAIVSTALLAIAILRRRYWAFVFALLQNLAENFIFVVSRSAVHCRAAFAEGFHACSAQAILVLRRFVGVFRKRALASILAMLRVPHGQISGVLLSVTLTSVSLLPHRGTPGGERVR